MKGLNKAILARWNSGMDISLSLNEPPQNTASPYAAFYDIAGNPMDSMNTRMDSLLIQFSIFSDSRSSAEVEELGEQMEALFDGCKLEIDDAKLVSMRRATPRIVDRDAANKCWHLHQDYEVILYKGAPVEAEVTDWQESVLTKSLTAPPASPASGARYLIPTGATGAWTGHDNQIATWNGAAWIFTIPTEGATVWIEDEQTEYKWVE